MTAQSQKADAPVNSRGIDLERIRALAEQFAAAHGLELVDLEWTNTRNGMVLRIVIDQAIAAKGDVSLELADKVAKATDPSLAGVTLDNCALLSRDLSTALDVEDLIPQAFSLEVTSPGLDRPLRRVRDFARQCGRLAKLKLIKPATDGQSVLRGIILAAEHETIEIDVDGNVHLVSLDNILDAKLVFEIERQEKRGNRQNQRKKR